MRPAPVQLLADIFNLPVVVLVVFLELLVISRGRALVVLAHAVVANPHVLVTKIQKLVIVLCQ
jgi:hypothetical protein